MPAQASNPLWRERERREELERIALTHSCHNCQGAITVAYIKQEHVLRCRCYPDPPAPERPESPQERYQRTGEGDTVTIQQTQRQLTKRINIANEGVKMAESTDIATFQTPQGLVQMGVTTVQQLFCPKASELEALVFLRLCQFTGLNPFLNEVYLVKYANDKPARTVVGKGAFTKRAEEHPDFAGFKAGIVVMRDKQVVNAPGALVLPEDTLIGGWAEVHRRGRTVVDTILVSLREYAKDNQFWNTMAATMIRKVALVQALREAFPSIYQGIPSGDIEYSDEPQALAFEPVDAIPVTTHAREWPPGSTMFDDEPGVTTEEAVIIEPAPLGPTQEAPRGFVDEAMQRKGYTGPSDVLLALGCKSSADILPRWGSMSAAWDALEDRTPN